MRYRLCMPRSWEGRPSHEHIVVQRPKPLWKPRVRGWPTPIHANDNRGFGDANRYPIPRLQGALY